MTPVHELLGQSASRACELTAGPVSDRCRAHLAEPAGVGRGWEGRWGKGCVHRLQRAPVGPGCRDRSLQAVSIDVQFLQRRHLQGPVLRQLAVQGVVPNLKRSHAAEQARRCTLCCSLGVAWPAEPRTAGGNTHTPQLPGLPALQQEGASSRKCGQAHAPELVHRRRTLRVCSCCISQLGRLPVSCRLSRLRSRMAGKPEPQEDGSVPA